jgi:hypothetical protein
LLSPITSSAASSKAAFSWAVAYCGTQIWVFCALHPRRFRISYGVRGAVCLLRGLVGELEEVADLGGIVFCCHAVGILVPGSYAANAAIAALTVPASGAFS